MDIRIVQTDLRSAFYLLLLIHWHTNNVILLYVVFSLAGANFTYIIYILYTILYVTDMFNI